MRKFPKTFILLTALLSLSACSHTIHERQAPENSPEDQGSETVFQLRGPGAAVQHRF